MGTKCAFAIVAIHLIFAAASSGQISFRTVVSSGDPIPGDPPGSVFPIGPGSATINNAGKVSFMIFLEGIWTDASGSLLPIARAGSPSAIPGGTWNGGTTSAVISDSGQTAFCALVNLQPSDPIGLFAGIPGNIQTVASERMIIPGVTPVTRFNVPCVRDFVLVPPSVTQEGKVAFYSRMLTSGTPLGIFSNSGSLHMVTRTGLAAPDVEPGVTFGQLGKGSELDVPRTGFIPLNDLGQVAFYGQLAGPGITKSNKNGIWQEGTGGLSLRVRSGMPAPAVNDGQFLNFSDPVINKAGHLAFMGTLQGSGIDSSNDKGVWSDASGSLSLLARKGMAAPGTGGLMFSDFSSADFRDVLINASGESSFVGALAGSGVNGANDEGIWAQRNGVLGLIAREGSPAPGTADGVTFATGQYGDFNTYMNDPGQIVFLSSLAGPGIDNLHNRGFWWGDTAGTVNKIVQEGEVVEIRPGDFRTISELFTPSFPTGGQDGLPRALNDFGEFVFRASFTDGSQAVLVAMIPEPASMGFIFIAAGLVCCRRRSFRWP
jgi:hypothetical protein